MIKKVLLNVYERCIDTCGKVCRMWVESLWFKCYFL